MRRTLWLALLSLAITGCAEGVPATTGALTATATGGGTLAGISFDIHQEPG